MSQNRPRILYITSLDPTRGPGRMALDAYNTYTEGGFEVDVLTLYEVEGYPQFLHVYNTKNKPFANRIIDYIRTNILNRPPFFRVSPGQAFFYRYEEFPFVSNKKMLSLISKKYDIVFIQFVQGMLSMSSIEAIYDKLKCQVHIAGVDFWQIAGGCHFIGNCEEYKSGCKHCNSVKPTWLNKFPSHNVKYRERVYAKVNPIIWGNSYMQGFYRQSHLLKDLRYELSGATLDVDNMFIVRPFDDARTKLGICKDHKFVISFGCQSLNDPRKGIKYLLEALNIFYKQLPEAERGNVAIVSSGNVSEEIKGNIPFASYHLGYVSHESLALMYSSSDVFLCSSINDAGPVMVNQALCCGTPVIAFEMGAALDSVKDKGTGFCVPLIDVRDFAGKIMTVYQQPPNEKKIMRDAARRYAESNFSKKAKIANMWRIYEKYKITN